MSLGYRVSLVTACYRVYRMLPWFYRMFMLFMLFMFYRLCFRTVSVFYVLYIYFRARRHTGDIELVDTKQRKRCGKNTVRNNTCGNNTVR